MCVNSSMIFFTIMTFKYIFNVALPTLQIYTRLMLHLSSGEAKHCSFVLTALG